jgi:hypothetical protein
MRPTWDWILNCLSQLDVYLLERNIGGPFYQGNLSNFVDIHH